VCRHLWMLLLSHEYHIQSCPEGSLLTSQNDPLGLSQVEAFGNSLEDSVSFRFPSWLSLAGSPFLR
jgi:hypothetical protein